MKYGGCIMRQLFQIGETVIICSRFHPEKNGMVIVLSANNEEALDCQEERTNGEYHYDTDDGGHWMQSALRKYHPPSTKSFREIMNEMKSPATCGENNG